MNNYIDYNEYLEKGMGDNNSYTSAKKFANRSRIDPPTTPTAKLQDLISDINRNHEAEMEELKKQNIEAKEYNKKMMRIAIIAAVASVISTIIALKELLFR